MESHDVERTVLRSLVSFGKPRDYRSVNWGEFIQKAWRMEVNHTTSKLLKPSELRATACCNPKARQQDINLQLASDDVFKRFETKTSGQNASCVKRTLSSNGSRASWTLTKREPIHVNLRRAHQTEISVKTSRPEFCFCNWCCKSNMHLNFCKSPRARIRGV